MACGVGWGGVVVTDSTTKMVSSRSASKGEDQVTVHSLVLWSTQKDKQGKHLFEGSPTFSMVSRYAERLVSAHFGPRYEIKDERHKR
jgi:hypothetical protein